MMQYAHLVDDINYAAIGTQHLDNGEYAFFTGWVESSLIQLQKTQTHLTEKKNHPMSMMFGVAETCPQKHGMRLL